MSNIQSFRKPALTMQQILDEEQSGTTLETRITQTPHEQQATQALRLSNKLQLDYSDVLPVLEQYGLKNTIRLARKTENFGEDFKTAAQLTNLVGYERTISLIENLTDLEALKQLIDNKEIIPVQTTNKNGYNVTYLLTKQFIESEKCKEFITGISHSQTELSYKARVNNIADLMKVMGHEETTNLMLEQMAGGKVVYRGMVNGFCAVIKGNGKQKQEKTNGEIQDYLSLEIAGNTYHLSEGFINSKNVNYLYKNKEGIAASMQKMPRGEVLETMRQLGAIIEEERGYTFVSQAGSRKRREEGAFTIRRVNGEIISISDDQTKSIEQNLGRLDMKRLDWQKEQHLLHEGYRAKPVGAAHYESLAEIRNK